MEDNKNSSAGNQQDISKVPPQLRPHVFKKGQSGNPNGRPKKGETLTDALRSKVDKDVIADKLIAIALEKGDIQALKYIYDRIDGMPHKTIEADVRGELPPFVATMVGYLDSIESETE